VPLLLVMISNKSISPESEMTTYYLQHIPMWSAEEVARCRAGLNAPLAILNAKLGSSSYLLGSDFSVGPERGLHSVPEFRCADQPSRQAKSGELVALLLVAPGLPAQR
jgi:hypothetical protein